MKIDEIIEKLKTDDLKKLYKAAIEFTNLDKDEFENYGFDNAVSKVIEVIELYNEIQDKKPDFWNYLLENDLTDKFYEIIDMIKDKLRELGVTPYILNDKGIEAQEDDDDETAMKYYKQAVILDPNYRWSWYNLGNIYRNKDDNHKAIECYKKAVEIYPDYGDAWNNMGNAYFDLNELNKAMEAYERAASIESYENRNYPIYNIGLIYEKKGDFKKALEYFKKAIEYKNDYAKAEYNAGRLLLKMGDLVEAKKYFTMALIDDFENYSKTIEEFNINVYDLLGRHLIHDILNYLNENEDLIENSKLITEKVSKYLDNIKNPFEDELKEILEDIDYKENWRQNFISSNAEKIFNHLDNWINRNVVNEVLLNNPIYLGNFKINLFLKSLEVFPGYELSLNIKNKLIYLIIESFDYFKIFTRKIKEHLIHKEFYSIDNKFNQLFNLMNNLEIENNFLNLFTETIINTFYICNSIIPLDKDNTKIVSILKKYLLQFSNFLNYREKSIKLTFFFLDCVQFFYENKEIEASLKFAEIAKKYFKLLNSEKDIKKCEKIIEFLLQQRCNEK